MPEKDCWLPARAALHPTGLYFSLREIPPAELQDAFMAQTLARSGARERVVQIARDGELDGGVRARVWKVVRIGAFVAIAGWLLLMAYRRFIVPMSYPVVETTELRPSRNYSDTTVISASGTESGSASGSASQSESASGTASQSESESVRRSER